MYNSYVKNALAIRPSQEFWNDNFFFSLCIFPLSGNDSVVTQYMLHEKEHSKCHAIFQLKFHFIRQGQCEYMGLLVRNTCD